MNFSVSNRFYPSNHRFDEEELISAFKRQDEEVLDFEEKIYNDRNFQESEDLKRDVRLQREELDVFLKGSEFFFEQEIHFSHLFSCFKKESIENLIHEALKELTEFRFRQKKEEFSSTLTEGRIKLLKTQAMREGIEALLPIFEEEKKLSLMFLEIERCNRVGFKNQARFRFPMFYNKSENDVCGSVTESPSPTTLERYQLQAWFSQILSESTTSSIFLDQILEKKNFLTAFLEVKDDPELIQAVYDVIYKIDREIAIIESIRCFDEMDLLMKDSLSRLNDLGFFSKGLNLVPLLGLILNILLKRDEAIDVADQHQKKWLDLMEIDFSLRNRVNWKYSHQCRRLIVEACRTHYFSKRQNGVITFLKEKYGRGGEALFDRYLTKLERAVIPLDLKDWEEEAQGKGKKKRSEKRSIVVRKESQSLSSSSSSPQLPTQSSAPPLTQIQKRLHAVSQNRFSYADRVLRWFHVDLLKDLSSIRSFKDRGEFTYEKVSDQELLKCWKLHSFPSVEIIYQDEDFRKRYTRENRKEEGFGFWMICRLETEGASPLDGRVRIGFDEVDRKRVVHRFLNPGNERGVVAKQLRGFLGEGGALDESDPFYEAQKTNQYFFREQLLEVEGKGPLETITMRDTLRKMTLRVIQIPSWIQ
jgi:hypothetical protein